jgi:hypothetical protein
MSEVNTVDSILNEVEVEPASATVDPAPETVKNEAETAETQEVAEPEKSEAEEAEDARDKAMKRLERRLNKKHGEAAHERALREQLEQRLAQYETQQQPDDRQANRKEPDVATAALSIVKAKEVTTRSNDVFERGQKAFGEGFAKAVEELHRELPNLWKPHDFLTDAQGRPVVIPTETMEAILDTDAPEKMLHYLGTNPEVAAELEGLSGHALGKKMERLERQLEADKPKVSTAPRPIKALSGAAAVGRLVENMTADDLLKEVRRK